MEVVVFTDTNIDTHFAISVSPDIITSEFKRELERTHLSLFPTLGQIKALQLTVRRKRHFYHLTDSLPLKYAFRSSNRTWFLHVSICLNKPITTDCFVRHTEQINTHNNQAIIEEISETLGCIQDEETTDEKTCETESVSIKCDFDLQGSNILTSSCGSIASGNHVEVENNYSNEFRVGITTPSRKISHPMKGSPNNVKNVVGVGRRIVVATSYLRVSSIPVISLYRQRLSCNVSSVPRLSVFEISDNDY